MAQLRKAAVDATKIANELAKKKQWDGSIAKYREALSDNPTLAEARFGIAEALEDGPKDSIPTLSEAAQQYQFYLAVRATCPPKSAKR